MNSDDARDLLKQAGIFFDPDEPQEINLNDVWGWACADGETVPDENLQEVAILFFRYGWCGVLWWVSQRRGGCRSEFADNNRFLDFVAAEEAIRSEEPNSNKRAYLKRQYTVGEAAEAAEGDE
jgi:hypothetical protein